MSQCQQFNNLIKKMAVNEPSLKLLCHFDNNTTDSSTYNRTPIQVGTIAYSSSETYRKWGYSMRILRNSSEYGRLAYDISDVDLSGQFCIDYWFNSIDESYWGQYVWRLSNIMLRHECGDALSAGFYTEGQFCKVTQTRKNNHHVAVTRDSNNVLRWFFDGVKQCEYQTSSDFTSSQIWLSLTYSSNTYALTWMDEVRIVVGEPCYTENFTPPTEPYTVS